MLTKIIKFEVGILIGTLLGAAVSTLVCTAAFDALGYDIENLNIIQECLEYKLGK
mgnify:FL=1